MLINPTRYRYRSSLRTVTNMRLESYIQRDRDGNVVDSGEYGYSGSDEYASPDQFCIDSVGFPSRDNSFWLSTKNYGPARYIGTHSDTVDTWGGGTRETSYSYDFPCSVNHAIEPEDVDPSDIEFVTKAAAETNLSKPWVQGAAFLAELRQLPDLFKNVGGHMSTAGANEYLKFQYGWRPLIKDLRKFLSIQNRIEKRLFALERIAKKGTLRRLYRPAYGDTKTVQYATRVHDQNYFVGPEGIVRVNNATEMRVERWCIVSWVASPPERLFSPGSNSKFDEVRNAVLGLNIDGPTIWQLMPWSWLADWTYNTSDYIASQANVVGAEFSEAILMKTTELTTTGYPFYEQEPNANGGSSETFLPGRISEVRKERILGIQPTVVNTGEYASILDDAFKTSILTSLGIQRVKRR